MLRPTRVLAFALLVFLLVPACQKKAGSSLQPEPPVTTDAKVSITKPSPGAELTAPIDISLAVEGEFAVEPANGRRVERHGHIALFVDTDLTPTAIVTPTVSITSPAQLTATVDALAPGPHKLMALLVDGAGSPWVDSRAEVTFTVIPSCEPISQEGLPEPVAAKRKAIYCAAKAGNFETVVALASPSIEYTFGAPAKGGFAGFLKAEGAEASLERIVKLLNRDYTVFRGSYWWQDANAYGRRVVIDREGAWVAYIAGD